MLAQVGYTRLAWVAAKMAGRFVERLDRIADTLIAFLLPAGHFRSQRGSRDNCRLVLVRTCSPTGRGSGFKSRPVEVRILARAPCPSIPIGRGKRLKPVSVQDRSLPGAPIHARLAQRQSTGFTHRRSRFRNSQRVPIASSSSMEERRPDTANRTSDSWEDAPSTVP